MEGTFREHFSFLSRDGPRKARGGSVGDQERTEGMATRIGVPVRLDWGQPPPFMGASLCAGFPSQADDYLEEALDPAQLIVTNPTATFVWRVAGRSMIGRGINDGDYLVVDRSLAPRPDDAVVAVIDGQPARSAWCTCLAAASPWTSTTRPLRRSSWTKLPRL